jgi:hypothetical protein
MPGITQAWLQEPVPLFAGALTYQSDFKINAVGRNGVYLSRLFVTGCMFSTSGGSWRGAWVALKPCMEAEDLLNSLHMDRYQQLTARYVDMQTCDPYATRTS